MEMPYNPPAPQGWQCPICKRVYSPTTPFCYYCGNDGTVSGVQTVPKGIEFDWTKHTGPMYISTSKSQLEQLHG